MNKVGVLTFHQNYGDIFNCLGLISYYSKNYNKIILIVRNEIKLFIEKYVRDLDTTNIECHFCELDDFLIRHNNKLKKLIQRYNDLHNGVDIFIHGNMDTLRTDKYKNIFNKNKQLFFCEKFYRSYDIDYFNRINCFNFIRDTEKENELFDLYVKQHRYIIIHEDPIRNKLIKKKDFVENIQIINLNGISNYFYDCIKLVINAEEIHLIDSCYANLLYLIDAKYGLFADKQINVYCIRGWDKYFSEPIKLQNWNIQ